MENTEKYNPRNISFNQLIHQMKNLDMKESNI